MASVIYPYAIYPDRYGRGDLVRNLHADICDYDYSTIQVFRGGVDIYYKHLPMQLAPVPVVQTVGTTRTCEALWT